MVIILLLAAFTPLLIGLSHYVGFDETGGLGHAAVHVIVAYGVAVVCSAVMLGVLAVLGRGMSAHEIGGKIALQSGPAALGALLAQAHFGSGTDKERRRREASYGGHLIFMMIGALYVALTVASTDLTVTVDRILPVTSGYLATFSIHNNGGETAAEVIVEGVLISAGPCRACSSRTRSMSSEEIGGVQAFRPAVLCDFFREGLRRTLPHRSARLAAADPGSASELRNAAPNISHTVTKSAARMGPRIKPITPNSRRPPSVEKKISSSCICVSRPTSSGRSRLSTLPMTSAQNPASAIPRHTSPDVMRTIAAGIQMRAPPMPGIMDNAVITVPQKIAPSIPTAQKASPPSSP